MIYFYAGIWVLLSFVAAYLAMDKRLGFFRTLLLSLVFSPIVGFILPHAFAKGREERDVKAASGELEERTCAHCGQVQRRERFDSLVCPMCRHNIETGKWTWHVLLNVGILNLAGGRYMLIDKGETSLGEGEEKPKTYPLFSKKVMKRMIVESFVQLGGSLGAMFFFLLLIGGIAIIWNFPTLQGTLIGLSMLAIAGFILWEKLRMAQKNIYLDGLNNQKRREGDVQ